MKQQIAKAIAAGRGQQPADLVLKGAKFFDLVSGELVASDIAISGDRIVGTCGHYSGKREIDVTGHIIVPGFIDTHLHVESSLVTPSEFDRCVLPHGVTTAICDPHEIANVLGAAGLAYFLEAASHLVMDLRVQLSSCVPATHLETAGASLKAADLAPFMEHEKVSGLAEFMSFPDLLKGDDECLDKLALFAGRHIDGHAPLLRGADLNGYLAAGIRTDHETTSADEALEKLRKGLHILIREGSVSKDLHALLPIITERHADFISFCSDDRNPLDIAEEGHLDFMIRTAITANASPLAVYRAASISAARAFRLADRGLVAPGWRADLVILSDFYRCHVAKVIAAGRVVDDKAFAERKPVPPVGYNSVKSRRLEPSDFAIRATGQAAQPVIGILPGKIITEHLRHELAEKDGYWLSDVKKDHLKVAVIERHGRNGNIGRGFVQGFGITHGAIAATVGHDSHNICVVGSHDEDMALAVNRLIELQGGFIVVQKGQVLGELPLPIAGLISDQPYEWVRDELLKLRAAAQAIGTKLAEPFLQLAFLTLPVIPHLKITDKGMVDVDRFELTSRLNHPPE